MGSACLSGSTPLNRCECSGCNWRHGWRPIQRHCWPSTARCDQAVVHNRCVPTPLLSLDRVASRFIVLFMHSVGSWPDLCDQGAEVERTNGGSASVPIQSHDNALRMDTCAHSCSRVPRLTEVESSATVNGREQLLAHDLQHRLRVKAK